MSYKKIYVAATSQHIGKTTSTLGLVRALKDAGHNVGYCKPVGQKFVDLGDLRVDKDALLFSRVVGFKLIPDLHSPVILGQGATTDFMDNPDDFDYENDILHSDKELSKIHDMIVYEGTGHPGVGSIVNLSNADVADLLGTPVLMIVEGGIGKTIDKLNMSIALFREKNVPIIGVIVNKVLPEKIDKVKHYVGQKLEEMGLPLLGVLPYDKSLMYPILVNVLKAIKGKPIFNEEYLDNRVEDIIPASLIESEDFDHFSNILLVSSLTRLDSAIQQIRLEAEHRGMKGIPLSGIVITREDLSHVENDFKQYFKEREYVKAQNIPVMVTLLDTLGVVIKINRIEVKINVNTPWKSERAIELVKEHVDLKKILNLCGDYQKNL